MNLTNLDRTQAPQAYSLDSVKLLHAKPVQLSNGIKIFCIDGADEEVVKLEVLFKSGTRAEHKKLLASATNYLLNSGTSKLNAKEIMEQIDYYGAFYQHDNQLDRASISLYTLKKYFKETLSVFADFLQDPIFPEEELSLYKENSKQRFAINITKNDFRARREFHHALYGDHPYGRKIEMEDYDKLDRTDILNFYKANYDIKDAIFLLTGNFGQDELSIIESVFYNHSPNLNPKQDFVKPIALEPQKIYQEKADALQSAIRIGKQVMHKTHPDYIDFSILTTVLGGYFGSRLMANIREDKGYTYGIGAGVYPLLDSAFFYIATEVGTEVTNDAIKEIYFEIERLKNELIPKEELDLVKNYLKGAFIGSIENIFSHADKFKSIYLYDLDYHYYEMYFNRIENISSERLLHLAKEYFAINSLTEVVIGKK